MNVECRNECYSSGIDLPLFIFTLLRHSLSPVQITGLTNALETAQKKLAALRPSYEDAVSLEYRLVERKGLAESNLLVAKADHAQAACALHMSEVRKCV